MLHVDVKIHRLNLLLAMGLFLCCFEKHKRCRAKDMGSISTPTMLSYMNFPETNVTMQQKQNNTKKGTIKNKKLWATSMYK